MTDGFYRAFEDKHRGSLDVIKVAQTAYEAKPAPTLFEVQRARRVSLYILKP